MSEKEPSLLQKDYIQKSRIFLLPLTGLKRDKTFRETNTYTSSSDLQSAEYPNGISFDDKILIVCYTKKYKEKQDNLYNQVNANFKDIFVEETGWDKHENILISNRNFLGFHETKDEYIYTFDLCNWYEDWNMFMRGKYSKMTDKAKDLIKEYRWSFLKPIEQRKLYCYLYLNKDESCLKDFAEELGVPIDSLKKVKELCDKPNLRLETFECCKKKELNETEG